MPQLIGVPKATVNAVVRAALSMSFVLGAATVSGGAAQPREKGERSHWVCTAAEAVSFMRLRGRLLRRSQCDWGICNTRGSPLASGDALVMITTTNRYLIMMTFRDITVSQVVFNLKNRFCKEQAWQSEMQGNITSQRRWEAYDKLGTFAIYVFTIFLSIQVQGLGFYF
jgi:hypothetical protein